MDHLIDRTRAIAMILLVMLVSSSMLGAAAVLYEGISGTHGGHALAGFAGALPVAVPVAVDSAGVVAGLLVAVQVMSGYELFRVRPSAFHRVHLRLAVAAVGVALVHGVGGVLHALQPPVEALPIVLSWLGVAIAVLLAPQLFEGWRLGRSHERAARPPHIALAVLVTLVVLGHVVGGVVHSVGG